MKFVGCVVLLATISVALAFQCDLSFSGRVSIIYFDFWQRHCFGATKFKNLINLFFRISSASSSCNIFLRTSVEFFVNMSAGVLNLM